MTFNVKYLENTSKVWQPLSTPVSEVLENFSLERFFSKAKQIAPTLCHILRLVSTSQKTDSSNNKDHTDGSLVCLRNIDGFFFSQYNIRFLSLSYVCSHRLAMHIQASFKPQCAFICSLAVHPVDMLAMSIWTKTNTNTTNNNLIVRSPGKQFLYGQKSVIEWYVVNIRPENDRIMNVKERMGLYTKSDVYNKRTNEIGVKLMKRELKQRNIEGVRLDEA